MRITKLGIAVIGQRRHSHLSPIHDGNGDFPRVGPEFSVAGNYAKGRKNPTEMMSFFQPSLPQVCTAFLELRQNGDEAVSHVQRSLSCTNGNPSNLPLNREDDGPEMGVLNTGALALAPCPIQSFSVLDGDELLQAFFSGKSLRTSESYRQDLRTFCEFLEISNITEAVRMLFSGSHRHANLTALKYRQYLIETKELKPKSINRKLSSLRSLVGLGQSLGMIPWKLSVKNQRVTELRNLAAPDPSGIKRLVKAAGSRGNKSAKRNVALCILLYTAGLRRSEAISLNHPEDVALERNVIMITGKGRTEKQEIILPEKTVAALKEWLCVRGSEAGPVFTNLDRAGKGDGRLTGRSVHRIIKSLGKKIGYDDLHPHALRRGAITALLKKAKGIYDVEECLDFSRHADVGTMMLYRKRQDSRENQAAMSRMLASDL